MATCVSYAGGRGRNSKETTNMAGTKNAKPLPTAADLQALMPAIEALARATPYSFADVKFDPDEPAVTIELPLPATNPMTVKGRIVFGSQWQVEVSGWSWTAKSVDEVRLTAGVLHAAHALAVLLE